MRKPKDITCGNDLNGLHSLNFQHGTEHFPDLISFIITTALWDEAIMKPPFFGGGKGDFK